MRGSERLINLDHAATTPLRREALEAMLPYFCDQYANASGSYASARKSRQAIDQARRETAQAIGAKPSEIYFTSGGTEADNWAIAGTVRAAKNKRHIVTTRIEHHAVLETCRMLEQQGYSVTWIDPDQKGRISVKSVRSAIREDTALVSVMLANNEIGTIEPVSEMASAAHEAGALMHTDAVQAVGHIPVRVDELGVDLLSMSAHKFYGPKGIGALYIRDGVRIEHLMQGGAQERNMRPGTENVPAIVGMGTAIRIACERMNETAASTSALRDRLESMVAVLPGVHINGDRAHRLPGHLHISVQGMRSQLLLMRLDMAGVAASAGSACSSGSLERSHVMQALGFGAEQQADIRFSIGENNTADEIERAADVLGRILMK